MSIDKNKSSIKKIIKGKNISLRPAAPKDKRPIFEWLTNSDISSNMIGPPLFPDLPVPDWQEFVEDYPNYFFDDSKPLLGRCFIIVVNGEAIGQINHDVIANNTTELDIWLKSSQYTGKGYGSDAIKTLCNYLKNKYNCTNFRIAPSKRNVAAVKAYEKAGFKITNDIPDDFVPDYDDAVLMIMELK